MSRTSPTQRTLEALRAQGHLADIWERWISFHGRVGPIPGVRKDGFGFVDLVYLDLIRGAIVGVQACAGASLADRRTKILTECAAAAQIWLRCHGHIEMWAWRKVKLERGGKAMRWQPRVVEITLADFGAAEGASFGGQAMAAVLDGETA
jgi:hypothetical protein